jgi:hypothetical protein
MGGVEGEKVRVPHLRGFPKTVKAPASRAQNFDGAHSNNIDPFWDMADRGLPP